LRRLALVAALLAAGCAGGLHSSTPPSQTYILRATLASPAPLTSHATATLQVQLPLSAPGLEAERIVIVEPDHRMSYYAGSEWAARLPLMVEELAIERLRAAPDWAAVSDSGSTFASDYLLQIRIRRFEAEYAGDAAPTAQVVFDCALARRADHELLASFTAHGSAVAGANRLGPVVAAFEEAANAALSEVVAMSAPAAKSSQSPTNP
jgi:cholesterol transport system auxiliary component